ncbi:MAG: MerR family transcriptional regulator [Gemmatimonadales bacterium]
MADEKLYSLREIAQELGLPESTVRYYRDSFADYLPTVGTGRRRRYPEEALAILRQVAAGYADNLARIEIEAQLNHQDAESVRAEPLVGFGYGGRRPSQDELVEKLLDGDRERREAMWQMAREIVRLGEVIERQQSMLGEVAKQLAEQANRTLPAPSPPQPAPQVQTPPAPPPPPQPQPQPQAEPAPAPTPGEPVGSPYEPPQPPPAPQPTPTAAPPVGDWTTPPPATAAGVPDTGFGVTSVAPGTEQPPLSGELQTLREQLGRERELVERLRKSKLDLERRAADAESRLGGAPATPQPRTSTGVFRRFFERDRY